MSAPPAKPVDWSLRFTWFVVGVNCGVAMTVGIFVGSYLLFG